MRGVGTGIWASEGNAMRLRTDFQKHESFSLIERIDSVIRGFTMCKIMNRLFDFNDWHLERLRRTWMG
jgi:hypothetical protein